MDTMSNIDWLFEGSVWSRHRCTSDTWCASVLRLGFGATIRDRSLVGWQRVYRRAAVNEDVGRRLASTDWRFLTVSDMPRRRIHKV